MGERQSGSIPQERIKSLNSRGIAGGDYVLYWMQQSQRTECNHALEFAVEQANELQLPLLVVFGLMDDYPEANLRHYTFLLEGLRDVQESLARRGIQLVVRFGRPPQVALELGARAALIVCDRGYLRHQREWRKQVAEQAACRVMQVEADVVVPVEVASNKAEYAARTIRPKIHKHLDRFLVGIETIPVLKPSLDLSCDGIKLDDIDRVLKALNIDRAVNPVSMLYPGGESAAKERFRQFLENSFARYQENRNQPQTDDVSGMAMYLHFGHVSPIQLALLARDAETVAEENREAFLEELIVRRELSINFVQYTHEYDSYASLPDWCRKTLNNHRRDPRAFVYTREQLENAETHDEYWNAAMKEMRCTGYMHNYMRMYWGKKILEWSAAPEEAYETILHLNNKYFLDGRDANSYGNVAWIFGQHDRPWKERPIFGTVRYMSAAGLERKCDIQGYVRKVEGLVREFGIS